MSNDGVVVQAMLCFGDGSPCSTVIESASILEESVACVLGGSRWSHRWDHVFPSARRYQLTYSVTVQGCPGLSGEVASYDATIVVS